MPLNITYEKSALASFLDEVPKLMLQYQMSMTGMEREAAEAAKDRAFRREMMENEAQLNLLAGDYQFQTQRLASLEDELAVEGYQLPEESKTPGFGDIKDRTVEGYEAGLQETLTNIDAVNKERALIKAGQRFISSQEDLYGGLVAAGEEEAWKDFMLEGGLTYDPDQPEGQQFAGTGEMADWINELSDEDLDRLKSENFRRAVLEGRRGVEEAQVAAAAGLEFKANQTAIAFTNLQIEKATDDIREGNYDAGMKRFTDAEKDINDRIFGLGKNVLSGINLEGYGVNYLTMLEDPDEYKDIMEEFIQNNPEIAQEMRSIIDNFSLSVQVGADWSEPVLRAQADAYSDFLEARTIEEALGEGDRSKGIAAIEKLPLTDPTRSRYAYLKKRTEQFRRAGLYGGGRNVEEMEVNLVNAFQLIKAKDKLTSDKLAADVEYLGTIAEKGYPIELEDLSPIYYQGMSEADQEDLLVSMELLRSFKDPDGSDPTDSRLLVKSLSEKVGVLKSLGLTGFKEYEDLVGELQSATFDWNQSVNQARIKEASEDLDRMLGEAAKSTGLDKELLVKQWQLNALKQIPWGPQRRTSAGRMY